MAYKKSDVEVHGGRPAVNIKVYKAGWQVELPLNLGGSRPANQPDAPIEREYTDPKFTHDWIDENVSEDERNAWFWAACNDAFEQLVDYAAELFGDSVKVYQEGRSGGWAEVHGLDDIEDWNALDLNKWYRFQKYARVLADDVPRSMLDLIYYNKFLQED